jgi:peptidoglycan/xylan/chitin deacetylase (PgdA/CDA1 family)
VTSSPFGALRVLMLHRVCEDEPTAFGLPSCYRLRGTAITPAEFVDLLNEVDDVVDLAEVVEDLRQGKREPRGTVLTFDDGYREWIDRVAPELDARGLPATFFASHAHRAEAEHSHAIDTFYWLLDNARREHLEVELGGGMGLRGTLQSVEGKRALVGSRFKQSLYGRTWEEAEEDLRTVARACGLDLPGGLAARLHPATSEWVHLAGSTRFRLGAHGLSHRSLPELGQRDLVQEIRGSLDWVMDLGGDPLFSYPDGWFNASVAREVDEAGCAGAVAIDPDGLESAPPWLGVPRVFIHPGTWLEQ